MKDQLEDFIQRNRDAFDNKQPRAKVWAGIRASLRLRSPFWANSVAIWRAAAIVFMALSAYLFISRPSSSGLRAEEHQVLKEFADVEAFYNQQISNKVELIGQFHSSDGLNGFTHDLYQLEAMYYVLKEEMRLHPSAKVKDALVLNLLVRVGLLNQQLEKLEDVNRES